MKKPFSSEYPPLLYFANYIDLVEGEDITGVLTHQQADTRRLFNALTEAQQNYRYAPGKWSPKQILGHLTDAERIFAYRALCIARGETAPLPGFDENAYVEGANFDEQALEGLLEQYLHTRSATLALARSLPESAQTRLGSANGHPVSARALFAIIAGHERHHLNILAERYQVRPGSIHAS